MKRQYLLMALSVMLCLVLSGCGGNGAKSFTSKSLGFTLEVPAGWAINESEGQVTIASSKDSLTAFPIKDSARVIVLGMPLDGTGDMMDPMEILADWQEVFGIAVPVEVLLSPTATTIHGQPAATLRFRGNFSGESGVHEITVISSQSTMVMLFATDTTTDNAFLVPLAEIALSTKVQ